MVKRKEETPRTLASALATHQGDWLRKALEYAGVHSAEMAHYLDVTPSTVSRWLNGHQPPSRQTLRLWALRTGAPLSYLETGVIPDDDTPEGYPPVNDPKQNHLALITNIAEWRKTA